MLHAQGLVVRRDGRRVLDGVSVSAVGGELVALMGPSGSGKSTLLACLAGDVRPGEGTVWMAGKRVTAWRRGERAVRRAVVLQGAAPAAAGSALEQVLLGRVPHGHGPYSSQDHAIAHAALDWLRLGHLAARPTAGLAHGERRMLQVARALAQLWGRAAGGDAYLLADDPTAGLDPVQAHQVMSTLRQLAGAGGAVVVALSDINLAGPYAQRGIFLRAGTVCAEGPPAQLLVPAALERTFGLDMHVGGHPGGEGPWVVPLAPLR